MATSGWFTFQHVFRDAGNGTLAVDLNLIDSFGNIVFTETRNNGGDLLATVVGGNGYGWFTHVTNIDGVNIDGARLVVVPLPPAAFAGLGLLCVIGGIRAARRR